MERFTRDRSKYPHAEIIQTLVITPLILVVDEGVDLRFKVVR